MKSIATLLATAVAASSLVSAIPTIISPSTSSTSTSSTYNRAKLLKCNIPASTSQQQVFEFLDQKAIDIWSHSWDASHPIAFRLPALKSQSDIAIATEILQFFNNDCTVSIDDLDTLAELSTLSASEWSQLKLKSALPTEFDPYLSSEDEDAYRREGSTDEEKETKPATGRFPFPFPFPLPGERPAKSNNTDPFFDAYQPYDSIVGRLLEWEEQYPEFVSVNKSIGKSVEGRDLPAIFVTDKRVKSDKKKTIFFNAGIHAREWISPATVMYILNKILTHARTDPTLSSILKQSQIVVTPTSNPDGYEYSRTNGNRLWRKNRRRSPSGAIGVDLNRNWDEHFGVVGVSKNPFSDTYGGPSAFSEPETKAISDFVLTLPNRVAGIDFHSFGQLILRSWGWNYGDSKNEPVLKQLGDTMRDIIYKVSGKRYTSQKGADLYPASGCTDDWMTTKGGMTAFTIELRDSGRYGFLLPATEIVPTGEEAFAATMYFVEYVLKNEIPVNEYVDNASRRRSNRRGGN